MLRFAPQEIEPQLSITRAWRLVKFIDNGMLTMTKCSKCGGHFVTHPHEIAKHYVCGLCNPPARAGAPAAWALLPWKRNLTDMRASELRSPAALR